MYRFSRWLVIAALMAFDASHTSAQDLKGLWIVEEAQAAGKKAATRGAFQFIDDSIIITNANGSRDVWKFDLNASISPASIDLKPANGPGAGKTLAGIYTVEDNVLKLCYVSPSSAVAVRPVKFEAASHLVILTMRRVAKPNTTVPSGNLQDIAGVWRLVRFRGKKGAPIFWEFRAGVLYVTNMSGKTISISQYRGDSSKTPTQISVFLRDRGGRATRHGHFAVEKERLFLDLSFEGNPPPRVDRNQAMIFEKVK